MKKIVLSLAVLATVALVSCGSKNAETADTDTMAIDSTVEMLEDTIKADSADTAKIDAAMAEAEAEVKADTAK
ncbi:MAG: hypothetical protein U0L83_08165 [Muribaculaceae bacterium]|nr:hypothetical protein [Muribaculaceae bacterium]